MQLNSIKDIKLELKRIRKRQNLHKTDAKVTRKKIKLRTLLWKLLRKQGASRISPTSKRKAKPKEETESFGKTKGTGRYI